MKQQFTALRGLALAAIVSLSLAATNACAQGYGNNGYGNNGYGNNGNNAYNYDNGYDDDVYSNGASYQDFYNELSPYGQWIQDPQYGYVWAPNAGRDFRPYYTNGYWAMTDYGNTWVSNYNWGWAPFHYGRWTYDNFYGWVWIPGNTWGPAWVSWRSGGGNYGWAPLGPGISVNISIGNRWNPDPLWWCFIPQRWIYNRGFQGHAYQQNYNNTYVSNTTIINNTYVTNNNTYISGPGRRDVERATGAPVNVYQVNNGRRPGVAAINGNSASFYRPSIRQATVANARPVQAIRPEQSIGRNQAAGGARNPAANAGGVRPSTGVRNNTALPSRNNTIMNTPRQMDATPRNNGAIRTQPNTAPAMEPRNNVQPNSGRAGQMNSNVRPSAQPVRTAPVQAAPPRYQQPTRPAPVYNSQPQPTAPRSMPQAAPRIEPTPRAAQPAPLAPRQSAPRPVESRPAPRVSRPVEERSAPQSARPVQQAPRQMDSRPAQQSGGVRRR